MAADDFNIPEGLSARGFAAAATILAKLRADGKAYAGGCKVFYSPEEWLARREDYGVRSELIVCHDGGDHARYFNYNYCDYNCIEEMRKALEPLGVHPEQCTSWYSAIYLD